MIGNMQIEANEHQKLLANCQKLGRCKGQLSYSRITSIPNQNKIFLKNKGLIPPRIYNNDIL